MGLTGGPELTARATSAVWWTACEIAVRYGVQLVVTVVLARLLQPADFGLLAMLMVFTTFAALLVEGGFGSALVQKQVTIDDEETSVFLIGCGVAALLATLLWWATPLVAGFYAEPMLVKMLGAMVWLLPLAALSTVPAAMLAKRLAFRRRAVAETVASLGAGGVALGLAWQGYGVWSLVWHALAGASLRALMLWFLSSWRPRGRFSWTSVRGLCRFAAFLLIANSLNVVVIRLQSLLIGRMFDARALGFYAMAQDTQQAPAQFVSSLLNRVGLPVLASVADQPERMTRALQISLRTSFFVFFPVMACVAVVAYPLVHVLYGEAWLESAPILSVLAMAAAFWPLHVLNLSALGAVGRTRMILGLEIAKAAVSLPIVVVASFAGVMEVAWAVLVSSLLSVLVNTFHARALVGYGMREQLLDILPVVLVSAVSAVCAWLAGKVLGPPLARLMLMSAVMATSYLMLAATLRLRAWIDFSGFMRGIARQRFGAAP